MQEVRSFETMAETQILAALGMEPGTTGRGFDDITQARVFADGLLRSRGRFDQYRTLYTAFLEAGKPFMIENLDEEGVGEAVPVKLVFSDEPPGEEVEESPDTMIWTERLLLDALSEERAIQDFFTELLDELAPTVLGA